MSAALVLDGALLRDRETDKVYAVHTETCERAFADALEAAGVSFLARFAPMGPTQVGDEACNWIECPKAGS